MNVSLTPELERFISDRVESGLYGSASEVVREGLRLLRERDELRQARLTELKHRISLGLEQLDSGLGRPLDVEQFKAQARSRRAARAA